MYCICQKQNSTGSDYQRTNSWLPSAPWTCFLCLVTCILHRKLSPQILQRRDFIARWMPCMWLRRDNGFLSTAEQMWQTQEASPVALLPALAVLTSDCCTADSNTSWTTSLRTPVWRPIFTLPAPAWHSNMCTYTSTVATAAINQPPMVNTAFYGGNLKSVKQMSV